MNSAPMQGFSPFQCPRHWNSNRETGCTVTIDRTETRYDAANKQHTVFILTVKSCCSNWTVYRRYREFGALHKGLLEKFDERVLPKLPGKKLLGSSMEADFIEKRRSTLEHYIRSLLSVAASARSEVLSAFLQGGEDESTSSTQTQQMMELKMKEMSERVKKLDSYIKMIAKRQSAKEKEKERERDRSQDAERIDRMEKHIKALQKKVYLLESSIWGTFESDDDNPALKSVGFGGRSLSSSAAYERMSKNISVGARRRSGTVELPIDDKWGWPAPKITTSSDTSLKSQSNKMANPWWGGMPTANLHESH